MALTFRGADPPRRKALSSITADRGAGEILETTYPRLVNRLKVMCGLNPVNYSEPMEGHCKLRMEGRLHKVVVKFYDQGEDPRCEISLSEEQEGG